MRTTIQSLEVVKEHIRDTLSVEDQFDKGFYLGRAAAILSDLIRKEEEREEREERDQDQAFKEGETDGHVVGPSLLFATAAIQSWFSEFSERCPAPVVLPGLAGAHDQFGGKYVTMTSSGVKAEGEAISEAAWRTSKEQAVAGLRYQVRKRVLLGGAKVIFVRSEPWLVTRDSDGSSDDPVAAGIRLSFSDKSISDWAKELEANPFNPEFFEA